MFSGDLPRQDQSLTKALDDAAAARLLRAARDDERLLARVTVEMLLRTGLRISEGVMLLFRVKGSGEGFQAAASQAR